ncbi:MAG: Prolyl tripeptidyl peptidase precursor, partial [Verrucomicrobiota bacterium]
MKTLVLFLLAFKACAADFDSALDLPQRTENKVFRSNIKPNWLPESRSFWYRVQTGALTHEFVLIHAETGERKTALTLKDLGLPSGKDVKTSALKIEVRSTQRTGEESAIKFVNQLSSEVDLFWINQAGERKRFGSIRPQSEREQNTFDGHIWLITNRAGEPLAVIEASSTIQTVVIDGQGVTMGKMDQDKKLPPEKGVKSPDGKWTAYVDKGLVMLQDLSTGKVTPLKSDLDGKSPFHGPCEWSPDSQSFVVSNTALVPPRKITLVESTPKGQLQPKFREIEYPKPGDPLPQPLPVIFRVNPGGHETMVVKNELFKNQFNQSLRLDVRWSPDSGEFTFVYNERGHQLYRVLAVNGKTGEVRVVVEETSRTFI